MTRRAEPEGAGRAPIFTQGAGTADATGASASPALCCVRSDRVDNRNIALGTAQDPIGSITAEARGRRNGTSAAGATSIARSVRVETDPAPPPLGGRPSLGGRNPTGSITAGRPERAEAPSPISRKTHAQGQRASRGKFMSSKGGSDTVSAPWTAPRATQPSARSSKACRVRPRGSTNQRCFTPSLS